MLFDLLIQAGAQGGITGTLAATSTPDGALFSADILDSGILDATQAPNVASISANAGTSSTSGPWDSTQAPNMLSMSGAVAVSGSLAATQTPNIAAITALEEDSAILAATQQPNTAGWGATVWDPTSLPSGAAFDLDASTITPVADGTSLSAWVDSISGFIAAQANGAHQPTYKPTGVAGQASVHCAGSQWFGFDGSLGANLKAVIDSGNFTVIVALANVQSTSIGAVFGGSGGGTAFNVMANGTYAGRYDGNVSGHTLPWSSQDFVVLTITSETAVTGNYGGMGIAIERDYMNGMPYRSTNAVVPATTANFGVGAQNDTGSGNGKFDILKIRVYPNALKPVQVMQAYIAIAQAKNQPLAFGGLTHIDITDGDSIGDGVGVDAYQSYPYLMAIARGRKPGQWANFSIGSIRVDQNTAKLQEIADLSNYLRLPFKLNFFEYINAQNNNQTSATIFSNVKAYLAMGRYLMGGSRFNIGDSTCYGRDVTDRLYASYRGVFNGLMNDPTTGIAPLADAFSPISANQHIGDGNAFANFGSTYIQGDTVHPNAAGHVELAGVMGIGLSALDSISTATGSISSVQNPNAASWVASVIDMGAWASIQQPNAAALTALVADPGVVAGVLASVQKQNVAALTGSVLVEALMAAVAAAGIADIEATLSDPLAPITGVLDAVSRPNVAAILGGVVPASLTVPQAIFAALRPLVGDRVYPNEFPQGDPLPVWPAIRYTIISSDPSPTLCGTNDEDGDDVIVFIDVVAKTYPAMRALKAQVITALQLTDPPCSRQPGGQEEPDGETRTQRVVMTYRFQQSSDVS